MEHDHTSLVLERIADVLGVRASAFTQQESCKDSERFREMRQETELLRLFSRVADPAKRLECLDYVRALSGVDASEGCLSLMHAVAVAE